jgi:hypothetical protein
VDFSYSACYCYSTEVENERWPLPGKEEERESNSAREYELGFDDVVSVDVVEATGLLLLFLTLKQ